MRNRTLIISLFLVPILIGAHDTELSQSKENKNQKDTSKPVIVMIDEENENKTEENDKGYKDGFYEGRLTAFKKDYSSWFKKGAGWSVGCTFFGAMGMCLYSNSFCDYPKTIPQGDTEFQKGFQDGYIKTTRAKRNSETLKGGLLGMFVLPAILAVFYTAIIIGIDSQW